MTLPPTVLLAVGESDLLAALDQSLRHRGYRVLTTTDGDRAVQLLSRQLPDVAVVDMLLPAQSGFQVTRTLAEFSDGRVPVVMISDHPSPAHRDYAFAAGVDRFLEKWLAPSRLPEVVESVLATAFPSGPVETELVADAVAAVG